MKSDRTIVRGLEQWHNNGIAVVDATGKFVGNALDETQAKQLAWNHNDEIRADAENRRTLNITGEAAMS